MSYILDALRKADAERERGAVPSINTQTRRMPDFDDEEPAHAAGIPPWAWLVLGLLLAALAAGLWWQFSGPAEPVAVAVAPPVPSSPSLPVTPPPSVPSPSLDSPSKAMPVPQGAQGGPGTEMLPPQAAAPPPRTQAPRAAPAAVGRPEPAPKVATPPAPKPAPVAVPRPAPNPAPQASAEKPLDQTQIVKFAALNPALKSQIPPMALGGAMYSPDARARMVIINGQVKREGEEISPGLTVRRIRANTVVFEFKGQLFEMLV